MADRLASQPRAPATLSWEGKTTQILKNFGFPPKSSGAVGYTVAVPNSKRRNSGVHGVTSSKLPARATRKPPPTSSDYTCNTNVFCPFIQLRGVSCYVLLTNYQ